MSEALFDVVFFGILQPGKEKETVMQNMAALFKTDAAKLAPYFAGGRKVIKGKINAATAEKYKAALENVGLVIKLEPCEADEAPVAQTAPAQAGSQASQPDSGNITMAEVGADVIEHPVEVEPQQIDDISDISMAEVGADVLEHPVEVKPQQIDDISDISMAEPGSDVLDHPREVIPQPIDDISDITMAEPGADVIANPKQKKYPPPPDTSGLSVDELKE